MIQAKGAAFFAGFSALLWMTYSISVLTAASFMTKKNGRPNLHGSLKQTFPGMQKTDHLESSTFPRCSHGKATCLPSTTLLMSHFPDVLCWQPWQKALNLFIHTCLILFPTSTSQPVGLGRWMRRTRATRGSGSWCHWISLTTSLTAAVTSEVTSTEEFGMGGGRTAEVCTFPAVDAYGNKYRCLLTLSLDFLGLFVSLVKKTTTKKHLTNTWSMFS